MAKRWREAFCPICGLSHGMVNIRPPEKPYLSLGLQSFWDRVEEYSGDKAFGVIKESTGRGSMTMVGYYDVDQDVEGFFPQIKRRLCNVIAEWIQKGWLSMEELQACAASEEVELTYPEVTAIGEPPPAKKKRAPKKPAARREVSAKKREEPAKKPVTKKEPPAPPTTADFGVTQVETLRTDIVSQQKTGAWNKQLHLLSDGSYEIVAYWVPSKGESKKEAERYSQTYDTEQEALIDYGELTSLGRIKELLLKE